ncbi:hypothetical protein LUZ62_051670 [Rhynchospora pubera]|uniref:GRAM domain-containing protein n=1 Tax=Rhynchospora pubera TaxID=906938 RepID=A0AAV8G8H2_9POAL|nr:hypothetical protein LUZ62_051670 [Rhynchospora pubera]
MFRSSIWTFILYKKPRASHLESTKISFSNQERTSKRRKERTYTVPIFTMMKDFCEGQVIGIPVGSSNCEPVASIKEGRRFSFSWINKLRKRPNNLRQVRHGDFDHENLSETKKGKENLGKNNQASRVERLFRKSFSVDKEERLLKGYKCCLSTTAGPINGTLFMSTKKIAFCSDKLLKITCPKGKIIEVPYKVLIPVNKVKRAIPRENPEQPTGKYLQIVTVDNFEFWFTGVFNHQNSSDHVENALSTVQ